MAIEARIRELGVRHQTLERAIHDELTPPGGGRSQAARPQATEAQGQGRTGEPARPFALSGERGGASPRPLLRRAPARRASLRAGCRVGPCGAVDPSRERRPALFFSAAALTTASSSSWVTRPSVTGSTGLMLAEFQCVRSRIWSMVALVVPSSLTMLAVGDFGVVAQEPGDGVGPVLAARDRACSAAPCLSGFSSSAWRLFCAFIR